FGVTTCHQQDTHGIIGAPPFRAAPRIGALPGHPERAVSWHSGLGAHARPKTTPVHHAARRRGSMAGDGVGAAGEAADHRVPWLWHGCNTEPMDRRLCAAAA